MKRILIIGKHWPEPESSAAGSRMIQLIEALSGEGEITFASAATRNNFSAALGKWNVLLAAIPLNDSRFDEFLRDLNPDLVLYDRFMTEEQFGWRVNHNCPHALQVLDTEDLHSLRFARQKAVAENREVTKTDLINEISIREIASVFRCDLSLIISTAEMEILKDIFSVPEDLLLYLPFMVSAPNSETLECLPSFNERKDFISIGNFLHAPNIDAVLYLQRHIWPQVRMQLPDANLHIYGAYVPKRVEALNNPRMGFLIDGRAENAELVVQSARVMLAPLRFGAGLKGKFITAMQCGTPGVTTSIGAEGMHEKLDWGGVIADDPEEIIAAAVALYTDAEKWSAAQKRGYEILTSCFDPEIHKTQLLQKLHQLASNLTGHRNRNFTGTMLQHHSMRSTEYMARWIEEKNKNRPADKTT